jgi:hypothetical protein
LLRPKARARLFPLVGARRKAMICNIDRLDVDFWQE